MIESIINFFLPEIIHILEMFGIIVITFGSIKTFIQFLLAFFYRKKFNAKIELGRALGLGLEFKMGAEILKTVLIRDMTEIWILGAIIILRAVLSLLIHFEIKEEIAVNYFNPAKKK